MLFRNKYPEHKWNFQINECFNLFQTLVLIWFYILFLNLTFVYYVCDVTELKTKLVGKATGWLEI